jgi:hypothetical protein
MGLLSYIEEHNLASPRIDASFFESGYEAGLFTLDFSDALVPSPQDQQAAFDYACGEIAALLGPPSRCYPGQNFQIKVVLATDHEISADLFAFQVVQVFTSAFDPPLIPDKIRVYPGGTARGENGMAAIENFLD